MNKTTKLKIKLLTERIEKLSGKKVMFKEVSEEKQSLKEETKTEFITKAETVEKQLKILGKDIKQLQETKQLLSKTNSTDKNTIKEIKEKTISLEEIRKSLILQKENYLFKEGPLMDLDKIIQNIFTSVNNLLKKNLNNK